MTATAEGTDMRTGFGVLFFLLAALSALAMYVGEGILSAFGFGAALLFGILLVVGLHLYD